MKAILSVILASMMLVLSAGFRVATHYCGNEAVSFSLTTVGVSKADWSKETKQIDIEFDASKIKLAEIKQKIA